MQSTKGRIANLEQSRGPCGTDPTYTLNPSERWANHMDGVNVSMFTDPQYDNEDEDVDKENKNTQWNQAVRRVKQNGVFPQATLCREGGQPNPPTVAREAWSASSVLHSLSQSGQDSETEPV